jgi:hypothetical protein
MVRLYKSKKVRREHANSFAARNQITTDASGWAHALHFHSTQRRRDVCVLLGVVAAENDCVRNPFFQIGETSELPI